MSADAAACWGSCCTVDPDEGALTAAGAIRFPWFRFILGLFVAGQTMLLGIAINLTPPESETTRLVLQGGMLLATLVIVALLGWPLLTDAIRALARLRPTMEILFLICVAGSLTLSIQSMILGSGPVYFDVVAVLLIVYSVGRAVSAASRRRALASMRQLTDALARARLVDADGAESQVDVTAVAPGDRVRVMAGELIPVDGRIVKGEAFVRETAFTGEWISARRGPGEPVLAATACEDAPILIEATSRGTRRRVDALANLIEKARLSSTSLQRQADRFVAWFLPLVALLAILTFVWWSRGQGFQSGLFHALAVLLVACPCAAGLASPLVFWTLLGRLARSGLVVRGGDAIERLANARSVIFDKTGTLGDERLSVERVDTFGPRAEVLAIVAAVERESGHPVAVALKEIPLPPEAPQVEVRSLQAVAGQGIAAQISVGGGMPRTVTILRNDADALPGRLLLSVEIDRERAARIVVRERLRDSAAASVDELRRLGLDVRVMTGDGLAGASQVARLAPTQAAMTPEAKHREVRRVDRPIYVGDGLNDAAAMAASYTSIAIAGGSSIAVESAAATLHGGDLTLVPEAIRLARHGVQLIRSNLHWAVVYNFIGIAAAATGHLHPVLAALLMAASSAIVSFRSFRLGSADFTAEVSADAVPVATAWTDQPASDSIPTSQRTQSTFAALHAFGLMGQAGLLAVIAGLSNGAAAALLATFAAITWIALRFWRRLPHWADMTFAMVTLGGLGMNFGWWADLEFQSVANQSFTCPCQAAAYAESGSALFNWMNAGMLLLGVPAMFLVRHTWERFRWSRWCCSGMLVLGIPGMVFGMLAGSVLAGALTDGWPQHWAVLADYALMMAGMCAGMLIPHALEYALPRRWRS